MRELSIGFFLLFLLFVCLDVSTTSYSLGIRNALLEEIDSRISLGAANIQDAINKDGRPELDLKKVYPILNEYALGWVELFDSRKNFITSSDYNVRFVPEPFPDTTGFWGNRYGVFPFDGGYLLVSASEEELAILKRVSRASYFLRLIVYCLFIALGIYIFRVFSYPFKEVRKVVGKKGENIDYTMKTIKEMAKDYREKLKSVEEREKELKQRLFLSRLGENVSQVLHEIRNSTGAIFGFGKLVENEEIKKGILEETSRLNDFSMHLLSLSGPLKPNMEEINIIALIDEVIKRLDNDKKIEIKVNIPENLKLNADGELVGRAIYNILDNAVDACAEKGKILVSVEEKEEKVNIVVEDTGAGMDKKTLSSIFDLFFTKKDGGVGVGLSVAKRIVESHDGDIKVKSIPGKGTTVSIILPRGSYE
jgi:signal transduction histidine kinase